MPEDDVGPHQKGRAGLRQRLASIVLRALLIVGLLVLTFGEDRPTYGKEFAVVGTVDCGRPSGLRCEIGDQLTLHTSSVSGRPERLTIDVSWIASTLPTLDQDDELVLDVEIDSGTLRAVGVVESLGERLGSRRNGREEEKEQKETTVSRCEAGKTLLIDDAQAGSRGLVIACGEGFKAGEEAFLFQPDITPLRVLVTSVQPISAEASSRPACPGEGSAPITRRPVHEVGPASLVCLSAPIPVTLRGAVPSVIQQGAPRVSGDQFGPRPTAVEYAVMLALIIVVVITAITLLNRVCIEAHNRCYDALGNPVTPTPSQTATPTPTLPAATSTFTLTPTVTHTPTITLTPTITPTVDPAFTITPTPTVTLTPTVTATATLTPTVTPTPQTSCIGVGTLCRSDGAGTVPSVQNYPVTIGTCTVNQLDCIAFTGETATSSRITTRLSNAPGPGQIRIDIPTVTSAGTTAGIKTVFCTNPSFVVATIDCTTTFNDFATLGGTVTVTR